jgi:hypothetical protein
MRLRTATGSIRAVFAAMHRLGLAAVAALSLLNAGASGALAARAVAPMPEPRHAHVAPLRYADMEMPKLASRELTILYLTGVTRGHVVAALELATLGLYDEAVLHSRHPIDEMLVDLSRLLSDEQSRELRRRFDPFNEAVALKSSLKDLKSFYDQLALELDEIDAATRQQSTPAVERSLNLIVLWLKQAAHEYEEAWDGMRLVNPTEFQDGFGFHSVANAALLEIMPELRRRDATGAEEILVAFERLKDAWPSVVPPVRPKLTRALFMAQIAIIEINARRFAPITP